MIFPTSWGCLISGHITIASIIGVGDLPSSTGPIDKLAAGPEVTDKARGRGDELRGHDAEPPAQSPKNQGRQTERNHIDRNEKAKLLR